MGTSHKTRPKASAAAPQSPSQASNQLYRVEGQSLTEAKVVMSTPGVPGSVVSLRILGAFEAEQGDDVLTTNRWHQGEVTRGGSGSASAEMPLPSDPVQAEILNDYFAGGPEVLVGEFGELVALSPEEAAERTARQEQAQDARFEREEREEAEARAQASIDSDRGHAHIEEEGSVERAVGETTFALYDNDVAAAKALIEEWGANKTYRRRLREDSRRMLESMAEYSHEEAAELLHEHGIWRSKDLQRFRDAAAKANPER